MNRTRYSKNEVGRGSPEYRSWMHMKERCHSPNADNYAYYGGRGIIVCEAWRNDFRAFYRDMGPRPKGCSIDRIDNAGPYTGPCADYPEGNCRWATRSEQMLNRRAMPTMFVDLDDQPVKWNDMAHFLAMPRAELRSLMADAGICPVRAYGKAKAARGGVAAGLPLSLAVS